MASQEEGDTDTIGPASHTNGAPEDEEEEEFHYGDYSTGMDDIFSENGDGDGDSNEHSHDGDEDSDEVSDNDGGRASDGALDGGCG